MNHTFHHDEFKNDINFEISLYSFLGCTICSLSSLISPLLFNLFRRDQINEIIPNFGSYGIGMIMSLMINHNLVEINEVINLNTTTGSVFLAGYLANYIAMFSFKSGSDCCHQETQIVEHCNEETNQVICENNINQKHQIKHWSLSIILGDSLCNLTDGIMITSSFIGCGYKSGLMMIFAVLLHEIPHELGDFAMILDSGVDFKKAIFYNLGSGLFTLLGFIITILFNQMSLENISLYLLIFATGMITAVSTTMLPRMITNHSIRIQNFRILLLSLGMLSGILIFSLSPHQCYIDHHDDDDHN